MINLIAIIIVSLFLAILAYELMQNFNWAGLIGLIIVLWAIIRVVKIWL